MKNDAATIVAHLRSQAAELEAFEDRPFDPNADYCRRKVPGHPVPQPMTPAEFEAAEAERWNEVARYHASRCGWLLSKAFWLELLEHPAFFDLHTRWRQVVARDDESPSVAIWCDLFCDASRQLRQLQSEERIRGTFPQDPKSPSKTHGKAPPNQIPSMVREWLIGSVHATADLIEALSKKGAQDDLPEPSR